MHELAIAQNIADVVAKQALACNAIHVKGVRLKIGEASGIVCDSLTFSFEMLASLDPLLNGTQLWIDIVPHQAYCRRCKQNFAVQDFVPVCPLCNEWSSEVVSGTELQILEMEIDTV